MVSHYGNHNRDLGLRHGRFTDDEWSNFQDNQTSGKSDYLAPGKTLHTKHYAMPLQEQTTDNAIATLLEALEKGMGNKVDIWYKLGCAYYRKNDKFLASHYLSLAMQQGHSDAKELFRSFAVGVKLAPVEVRKPAPPSFKYFRVIEFVRDSGKSEWLLLVSLGDGRGLISVSTAYKLYNIGSGVQDVYDNRQDAIDAGKLLKTVWLMHS